MVRCRSCGEATTSARCFRVTPRPCSHVSALESVDDAVLLFCDAQVHCVMHYLTSFLFKIGKNDSRKLLKFCRLLVII